MPAAESATLKALIARLKVAHHLPGRIRLKLERPLAEAQEQMLGDARRLTEALAAVDGIRAIGFNPLARSCVVDYDPNRITPEAWHDLIAGIDSPPAASLLQSLASRLTAARSVAPHN